MIRRGTARRAWLIALTAASCSSLPAPPPADSILLASDVEEELHAGAVLIDVRGPTERARDGVPRTAHQWLPFGPDNWAGQPPPETVQSFQQSVASLRSGRPQRFILLCSVGVRSSAAARALRAAGHDADSIMDGWLGNDAGPGLRANQR